MGIMSEAWTGMENTQLVEDYRKKAIDNNVGLPVSGTQYAPDYNPSKKTPNEITSEQIGYYETMFKMMDRSGFRFK